MAKPPANAPSYGGGTFVGPADPVSTALLSSIKSLRRAIETLADASFSYATAEITQDRITAAAATQKARDAVDAALVDFTVTVTREVARAHKKGGHHG